MFDNVTASSSLTNGSMRFCSWATEDVTTVSFYAVTLATTIIIAIFSPVVVIGNALTMAVIWKNQSLRTTSYILLCDLAFTDLCTGLVTLPFHVTADLICLENSQTVKKQLTLLRSSRVIMDRRQCIVLFHFNYNTHHTYVNRKMAAHDSSIFDDHAPYLHRRHNSIVSCDTICCIPIIKFLKWKS